MNLIVTFPKGGRLPKNALELVSAARALGGPVQAAVLGAEPRAAAEELAKYVDAVHVVAAPELEPFRSEPTTTAVAALVGQVGATTVLAAASRAGLSFTPRLAVRLGGALLEDVIALAPADGGVEAKRYSYLSRVTETVRSSGTPVIVSVKPNVFAPADAAASAGSVNDVAVTFQDGDERVRVGERSAAKGGRVALDEAKVVVAGGRGVGSEQGFADLVEPLADALNAGIGATRAVVDAGWRPYGEQVGQTGKTVAPDLYIALGISGAVQHLSGMNRSKVIVAVNKDADAPIFKIVDYGIVGDVQQVVPALRAALEEITSS